MAGACVKDYAAALQNQGGVLDIADAWLVAVPACAALVWQTRLG